MVRVGDKMPTFSTHDAFGLTVRSEDLFHRCVVLYFYSKDDTPKCTQQACEFRDKIKNFREKDAIIIGVSPDSSLSHKDFISKYTLPFTLLVDDEQKLQEVFGVKERTTFIIDPYGTIRWIERPVEVDGHADRVLKALDEIEA